MNIGLNNKIFLALTFFGLLFAGNAQAIVINTTVPGSDNLYFDNWGHSFVTPGSNAGYALGRGTAPSAVAYAFSSGQALDITAGDCVVDAGASCTGPDGYGSLFRGLPVYSLIGVWSSDFSSIAPVEGGVNPAFFHWFVSQLDCASLHG